MSAKGALSNLGNADNDIQRMGHDAWGALSRTFHIKPKLHLFQIGASKGEPVVCLIKVPPTRVLSHRPPPHIFAVIALRT